MEEGKNAGGQEGGIMINPVAINNYSGLVSQISGNDGLLPLLLDKLSTKDLTAVLGSHAFSITRLTKIQILRLSKFPNVTLPPYAQQFKQILQQPRNRTQGVQNIRGIVGLNDEEKDAAIALYIEHHEIELSDIKQNLNNEELLRLAPHLRYVDLRNFMDIPLAQKFLQKCSNLNVLIIMQSKMLEGTAALPFCEKLYCTCCYELESLPELPLCKELNCSRGTSLKELPALPLCEKLVCSGCTSLKELPSLPLCEELECKGCTSLQALHALPLCKVLNCYECANLLALPALPLCKELICSYCHSLKELPALPLCEKLDCRSCTTLLSLPALSLCRELHCYGCECLQALPALPLCKELDSSWCKKLQALPALPLCEKLECYSCMNLQALPALPFCEKLECCYCPNLTTLPLSLGQNPGLTHIDIQGTGINPAIRDAILNQCRRMRDAGVAKILPFRLAKWNAIDNRDLDISTLSLEQKIILNEWLLRLERTQDFTRSQSLLANTVCNILADLVKNKEFQELFFPQAEANNTCCQDRAAMSLNEIYTSWKIICTSENLKVLAGVAKTLRLRKELQKLIRGDERESVEIFLYYESTLRERLDLVTAVQNMTYGTIGKRDWINEDKLVEDVEANFFEELVELPVFEKMIVFDDLEFSTKLENLGECPAGGPNDSEVLNYQHRQGEIMQEWKREKMRAAKKLL